MEHRGPLPDLEIPDVSLYELLFGGLAEADAPAVARFLRTALAEVGAA